MTKYRISIVPKNLERCKCLFERLQYFLVCLTNISIIFLWLFMYLCAYVCVCICFRVSSGAFLGSLDRDLRKQIMIYTEIDFRSTDVKNLPFEHLELAVRIKMKTPN